MFLPIFLFEIRYRLKRPATWIYFGLFATMAFLVMLAVGGAFPGGSISVGGVGPTVKANAPVVISWLLTVLSWFGVLVASALLGNGVYRDFEHRTASLFFTTPIDKVSYLGGRFAGSFVVALLVFSGLAIGAWLGTITPFTEAGKMGPNHLSSYLWPYLVLIVPNLVMTGGIVFCLATLTRNILSTYLAAVGLLIGYLIAQAILQDLDNELLATALDPFGAAAVYFSTRYWTPAEQNTLLLPLTKFVVVNRAIWGGLGVALLALTFVRFRFSAFSSEKVSKKVRRAAAETSDVAPKQRGFAVALSRVQLPTATYRVGGAAARAAFTSLVKLEWRAIVRNVYFVAIVAAGVLFLLANADEVGKIYDTTTYPVTGEIVGALTGQFTLFLLIIIIFYSGEAVWRDRDANLNQITDATPVRGWVPLLAKWVAMSGVMALLLLVVMVMGIVFQTVKGYFNYELPVYLTAIFAIEWPRFVLFCALALVVQVVVNNKYLGHFVMVAYYLLNIFRSQLGLNHRLFGFTSWSDPGYSALNGWGHFLEAVRVLQLHWALVAGLMLVLGYLLWVRGTVSSMGERWREAGRRFGPRTRAVTALLTLAVLATGTFVFYNTNRLNIYRTPQTEEKLTAEYEKLYRKYLRAPQPRITAVNVQTDLYPSQRAVRFRGHYWLLNRSARPIDSLHIVGLSETARVRELAVGRSRQVLFDSVHSYRILQLAQALAPGDSVQLRFDLEYRERGFPSQGSGNTSLVQNGTFVNSQLLPTLGYQEGGEISDVDDRKRLGLKPKRDEVPLTDSIGQRTQAFANDADWLRFETVVTTEPDQIAVAPGYLLKEWTKDGRRYFHYRMDRPIDKFFAFVSARYTTRTSEWRPPGGGEPVAITVYFHPGHEYNVNGMIRSVKESLTYYGKHFYPYPDRQVRILEFPNYSSFAQSFVNTIPYSESIGFIAKVDSTDPESVDYPYYVTAHEMAHQWWGHQVMPAAVEGSQALSETMAQYSALMLMKAHVGAHQMQKFLQYELNRYLSGRSFERRGERTIAKVGGSQQHIYYRKGSVVMYGLADYVGEANLNAGLGEYVRAVRIAPPPYPTTPGWVAAIQRHTPDSLHRFVTDGLERIALYDNRLLDATAAKLPDGQWRVTLTVQAGKVYADSLGNEKPAPATAYDALPIALLPERKRGAAPPEPLLLVKRRVRPGKNVLVFTLKQKPAKAGVDPYNVLVDRTLEDNVKDVSDEGAAPKKAAKNTANQTASPPKALAGRQP